MKAIISQFFGITALLAVMIINNIAVAHTLTREEQYMASHGWFVTERASAGNIELQCHNKSLHFKNVKAYRIDQGNIYIGYHYKNTYDVIKNTDCMLVDRSYRSMSNFGAYTFLKGNSAMKNSLRKMGTINPTYCSDPAYFLQSKYSKELVEYYYADTGRNQVLIMVATGRVALRAVDACR